MKEESSRQKSKRSPVSIRSREEDSNLKNQKEVGMAREWY
jgi:hypothetical protein